jgi:ribosomal protein S18 acetylase RimI-like enzyme
MILVRRARPTEAIGIAAVHVAAWRSAYPGILPDAVLTRLSVPRQAAEYEAAIRAGQAVFVATAPADAEGAGRGRRVIGFATCSPTRRAGQPGLAEGEIETLYVLDDYRDRGIGRELLRSAGKHLLSLGCRSAFLWVLSDNPSRWFYARLGGRAVAERRVPIGGVPVPQTAFVWDPIDRLLQASTAAP